MQSFEDEGHQPWLQIILYIICAVIIIAIIKIILAAF